MRHPNKKLAEQPLRDGPSLRGGEASSSAVSAERTSLHRLNAEPGKAFQIASRVE